MTKNMTREPPKRKRQKTITEDVRRLYAEYIDDFTLERYRVEYQDADAKGRLRLLRQLHSQFWGVPDAILELAVTDTAASVRAWVAERVSPFSHRQFIVRLADDPHPFVRAALALNVPLVGIAWESSSDLERLAFLHRDNLTEDFVVKLFDPEDRELATSLSQRRRYTLAFLSSRADRLGRLSRSYDRAEGDAGMPLGLADLLGSTGTRIVELMPKWPPDAGIQDFVYRFCASASEGIDRVYASCLEPRWRCLLVEAVLQHHGYWYEEAHPGAKLLALARRDPDDRCREAAYRDVGLRSMRTDVFEEAVRGDDKPALCGLAANNALSKRQLTRVVRRLGELGDDLGRWTAERTLAEVTQRDPWEAGEIGPGRRSEAPATAGQAYKVLDPIIDEITTGMADEAR